MKCDPTTLAGMVGGAALAIAALPGLPRTLSLASSIVGAAPRTAPPNHGLV